MQRQTREKSLIRNTKKVRIISPQQQKGTGRNTGYDWEHEEILWHGVKREHCLNSETNEEDRKQVCLVNDVPLPYLPD